MNEKKEDLKDAIKQTFSGVHTAFNKSPSICLRTIWMLRRLLDQIENDPENGDYVRLVVDFQTGKIDCERALELDRPPLHKYFTYSVDVPFLG